MHTRFCSQISDIYVETRSFKIQSYLRELKKLISKGNRLIGKEL